MILVKIILSHCVAESLPQYPSNNCNWSNFYVNFWKKTKANQCTLYHLLHIALCQRKIIINHSIMMILLMIVTTIIIIIIIIIHYQITIAYKWTDYIRETEPVSTTKIIMIKIIIKFCHQITTARKWTDYPRDTEPVSTKWKWWQSAWLER